MDINDVFEKLLFAEETAEDSAYEEGYKAGKSQQLKGFHLGFHRASLLAAQLGYYSGVLTTYQKNPSEKVAQSAKKLLQDINDFPKHNDESVDILTTFESIKFKYNKFCSLVKISSSYPEMDKLSF